MEEIPNSHLGSIKPWKSWEKLPINWCRISAINSITNNQKHRHLIFSLLHVFQSPGGKTPQNPRPKSTYSTWMFQEFKDQWLVNGLLHLLINGVYIHIYWGEITPLILTFDPNFLGKIQVTWSVISGRKFHNTDTHHKDTYLLVVAKGWFQHVIWHQTKLHAHMCKRKFLKITTHCASSLIFQKNNSMTPVVVRH